MKLKQTEEVIGDCGILLQQVEGERFYESDTTPPRPVAPGLATEAAIACRDWAFAHLKTNRLISLIRPEICLHAALRSVTG